ncbi:cadherin-like beta sandwich domain-containing protein [Paenibacillus sp. RC67]|uniref:cadherin-like beta sandwich domain-containing protein n=1 Tax=Paenibacillus sp. RC67 TaxID=3039392 RepID=UPI0024ADF232|nr:cadherin-like beta sandwich domain-containing protein [Paenibacillus sp. RC67]
MHGILIGSCVLFSPEADPQYMPPTGVAISGPTTLSSTGSVQLQAQITQNTATVKDVIWTSSNPAIATVDSTGKVTAVAAGNVTITATSVDGTFVSAGVVQQAAGAYELTILDNNPISSNADLSSLTLSSGTISPAFASSTTEYTSSVASAVSSLSVTASVYDKNAKMTVNGNPVASGQASGTINLQAGSNPITIVVTAQNGTTKSYSVTVNRAQAASSNADLSSLTLSSGTISPAFASGTTEYTSSVASAVSSLNVTASVYDKNAKMTVNGNPVASGQASGTIDLQAGSNPITIVVTAQNGTTKSYSVTVNRAQAASSNADLSSLTLSSGTLSPVFASGTTEYTSSVASAVSILSVTASVYDKNAKMTVNGNPVASGQASGTINLQAGSNPITIVVTAQDGTTKSYSVTINRAQAASSNADLSSLTLSNAILSPAFASGTTAYTSSVASGVSSITVTASVYDKNATMTVNGNSVTSGQASGPINLQVGSNPITIVVTAQDGLTKTYSVTVNRLQAANTNADLSSLTLSNAILSPAFASGTTAYTSSVASGLSSITVSASVYDKNATMTVNGNSVTSGQASGPINLQIGNNIINIVVTAQDGTTKTYNVTVTRVPSSSSSRPSSGGSSVTTPSDTKMTATDGKLTLPAGKSGEVSLGSEIVISIPSNASSKELKLTIEKLADTQALLKNKEALLSSIFEILKNFPENFSNPVTLTFTFNPASLKNNQTAGVFYYDEVKKVWVEVKGSKINGNKITAEVDHFTKYAVFAVDSMTDKPTVSLSDIIGHWAEANIKKAVGNGIVSGYPDGTFKPNNTVTRAEFAVMLMNTLKPQGEGAALTFTDTAKIGSWAQKAVAQAYQAGIVKGYEDGSFRPDAQITRAEMAVMLANALGLTIEANTVTGFADDKDVPAWAKGAVAAMKKQQLVEGKGDNEFAPTAPTTRAEAVTVLLKMLAQKSK